MVWDQLAISGRFSVSANGRVGWPLVGVDGVYAGDRHGDVIKVSRTTLQKVWRRPAENFSPAHVVGDMLILGSISGELRAIHTATGNTCWTIPTSFGAHLWGGLLAAPRRDGIDFISPPNGRIVNAIQVEGIGSPGMLCGDVFICEPEQGGDPVAAYHLSDGRPLWKQALQAAMKAEYGVEEAGPLIALTPGSLPDTFIATRGGAVFGCSLLDGRLLWCVKVPVPYMWPNVHGGRVYVLYYERFIALDERTGRVYYDVQHSELTQMLRAKAGTVYANRLAIPDEFGHLAVLDTDDGHLVWLYKNKAPLWRTAEADGRLLVSTGDGKVLVFSDKGRLG